jgi:hypothetical protein
MVVNEKPYVKILRRFKHDSTQCKFCKTTDVLCHWITQGYEVDLYNMRMGGLQMRPNCERACDDCMREMGLLW